MPKSIAGSGDSRRVIGLQEDVANLIAENERMAESYAAIARATLEFDEVGWSPLNQLRDEGLTLDNAKLISANARRQMNNNALLKRGAALRASYVFGRGFKMASGGRPLPPRFQQIIDNPINQQVLFSEAACKKNEKTLFATGNFFVRYDKRNKVWGRIPLDEIVGWTVDQDDPDIIKYILREYQRVTGVSSFGAQETETVKVWYPMDYTTSPNARISGIPVDRNFVVVDLRVNDDTGSAWGAPDCLPALPWAWAYSEYLKDGSKMLKALSSIAWQVKSKTNKGGQNISAKVLNNRQVASTAVTGSDVELSSMPRNNAVDLNTGRPIAAMAASAMEVSVDALLSGGTASDSGAMALDQSTLNAAYGRQGNWEYFFVRVLRVMGVQDPTVKFNKIIVDPSYRSVQSLGQAWMTGLFDPNVIQAAYAEELGIEAQGSVPEGVIIPNHMMPAEDGTMTPGNDMNASDIATNVATSQGNSGAGVGDLSNGDNTLRDDADNPR